MSAVYQRGEKEKKSWLHGGGGGGSWEPWGWVLPALVLCCSAPMPAGPWLRIVV